MEIKIGDVLQLKSVGPEMTVQDILGVTTSKEQSFLYKTDGHSEGELICNWFAFSQMNSLTPQLLSKLK